VFCGAKTLGDDDIEREFHVVLGTVHDIE